MKRLEKDYGEGCSKATIFVFDKYAYELDETARMPWVDSDSRVQVGDLVYLDITYLNPKTLNRVDYCDCGDPGCPRNILGTRVNLPIERVLSESGRDFYQVTHEDERGVARKVLFERRHCGICA